ncbi:MAG TPA: agmatine deiminase family protein [Xanthomonadales bacterium]|nr:agmatine deiminase family protein [Xanthomonadales bacterium]
MAGSTWRLPAEWEPQDGVLLAWPHAGTDWRGNLADVEQTYAALVAAISRFERALVCVAGAEVRERAQALLQAADAKSDRVSFVAIDYDDTWLRDSGPISLAGGARRFRLVDFRFTGWGGKFEASRDDALVATLHHAGLFGDAEHVRADWALEGGAIESDGEGTILTTWQCLNHRHPHLDRDQLRTTLAGHLGAKRVLILEHGHLEGDDTDAHIDTLARFASPTCIVYQGCDDPTDSHFDELGRMADELRSLRRADGEPYELVALPWARPVHASDGRRLAASYANFLIVNGAVLMPAYGDAADGAAAKALAGAFAGREIVPVPCRPLIEQNGSLHCVTMQLPRGVLHVA